MRSKGPTDSHTQRVNNSSILSYAIGALQKNLKLGRVEVIYRTRNDLVQDKRIPIALAFETMQ